MSRKNASTKWTDSELREIQRLIRRYNTKRRRTLKNDLIAAYQPEAIKMKDIKSLSKKSARIQINNMKRYLKKGMENVRVGKGGAIASKYQIETARAEVKRINRARAKEMERLAPSSAKGNVHIIEEANLRPMKFNFNANTQEGWKRFMKSARKQAAPGYWDKRDEQYKQNYLSAMQHEGLPGWLIDFVGTLSPRQVVDALYDDPTLEIGYVYSPTDLANKTEQIKNHWSKYTNVNLDDVEEAYNKAYQEAFDANKDKDLDTLLNAARSAANTAARKALSSAVHG